MIIRDCVEKAKVHSPELSEDKLNSIYCKFFVSAILVYTVVVYWTISVVSDVSEKLLFLVELALSAIFVFILDNSLKSSAENKVAFRKVEKFSKLLWLWIILLVLSIVAVIFLKLNLLL